MRCVRCCSFSRHLRTFISRHSSLFVFVALEETDQVPKIDATLERDDEDNDGGNQGDDSENENDDNDDDGENDKTRRVPTIQLKVAIGDVDQNPVISILASDDENDDDNEDGYEEQEQGDADDDEDEEEKRLQNEPERGDSSTFNKRKLVSDLLRDDPPKAKQPLIEEM